MTPPAGPSFRARLATTAELAHPSVAGVVLKGAVALVARARTRLTHKLTSALARSVTEREFVG